MERQRAHIETEGLLTVENTARASSMPNFFTKKILEKHLSSTMREVKAQTNIIATAAGISLISDRYSGVTYVRSAGTRPAANAAVTSGSMATIWSLRYWLCQKVVRSVRGQSQGSLTANAHETGTGP